ncbi:hypothetical protein FHL15_006669 [Xylaria flabelliformis]|uniref:Uncharacterized protein n=1 Tax=Xylaria flabelliformis TaxID=2512241 RepID=A0A553HX33_9PEZI|nr:hypothetical protein FHL15_006669 [Xylaria flabelliformis]
MSIRPTTPTDTLAPMASSNSSQKATTIESEISSDTVSWGPRSLIQSPSPCLYPRFPPVAFLPSRTSPTELPTHHPYPESAVHYNEFSRNGPSDLLPYIEGHSGRTMALGIVCVVVIITLILLVILILSTCGERETTLSTITLEVSLGVIHEGFKSYWALLDPKRKARALKASEFVRRYGWISED